MKRIIILLVVLTFVLSDKGFAQLVLNSKLPEFTFYTLSDSSKFTPDNIDKTKPFVLLFFDATCDHCQQEVYAIGKRFNEFKMANFYLVTMDEKSQATRFMSFYGKELMGKKNVTVLLDPGRDFMMRFQPERFPSIFIYSKDQQLLWHKDGQREIDELINALR